MARKDEEENQKFVKYKSIFFRFLKDFGLFLIYIKYYRDARKVANIKFDDFFKSIHPFGYMYSSFIWEKTEEGFDYWQEIEYEWIKYFCNNYYG